jgi:hypothetical protein
MNNLNDSNGKLDNLTPAQRQRVNSNAERKRIGPVIDEPSFGEDDVLPIINEIINQKQVLPPAAPQQRQVKDNARGRMAMYAEQLVNRDRNNSYGDPNQDFARTSAYWNIHLFAVINRKLLEAGHVVALDPVVESVLHDITDAWDVGLMMGQLKDSRMAWNPGHLDGPADKIGYTLCYTDCVVAAGLLDINAMEPVGGRVVDPPQAEPNVIPLHVPENFDKTNQFHILQLLQQTPPSDDKLTEPRPDQVAKMTVGEYAEATGRLAHLNAFMEELWPELDATEAIPYKHLNIGDAMKAVVMPGR